MEKIKFGLGPIKDYFLNAVLERQENGYVSTTGGKGRLSKDSKSVSNLGADSENPEQNSNTKIRAEKEND